jgi:hypothetical protein
VVLLGPPAQPDSVRVEFDGAVTGIETAPTVLAGDTQTVLIYRVEPGDPAAGAVVTVHTGGSEWQLGGVFGSPHDASWLAARVTDVGVVDSPARLRAASEVGCRVSWTGPRPRTREVEPKVDRKVVSKAEPEVDRKLELKAEPDVDRKVAEIRAADPPTLPMTVPDAAEVKSRRRWWPFGRT